MWVCGGLCVWRGEEWVGGLGEVAGGQARRREGARQVWPGPHSRARLQQRSRLHPCPPRAPRARAGVRGQHQAPVHLERHERALGVQRPRGAPLAFFLVSCPPSLRTGHQQHLRQRLARAGVRWPPTPTLPPIQSRLTPSQAPRTHAQPPPTHPRRSRCPRTTCTTGGTSTAPCTTSTATITTWLRLMG